LRSPHHQQRRSARLALLGLAGRALRPFVTREAAWPRRVLLLRPDHIGDVLLTAPAVALLRASLPDAHVTYMVGPWSAEAAQYGPPVDELRSLAYPGFTRLRKEHTVAPYALLAREARRLQRQHYDLAVMFRPDHWWGALLALAAGIPVRVGGRTPENASLLTHQYANSCAEHAADRSLAVARLALRAVGATPSPTENVRQFDVNAAARLEASEVWRRHGLVDRRVVALHPSAGAPLKSWPLENWSRLADGLIERSLSVLLVGAPEDQALLSGIVERMSHANAVVACGQSLSVSAALYQRCTMAITVDSGAGHLAAAVGTPTVRLYGPAPPSIFGPWPTTSADRVLITDSLTCVPCGDLESPPCGARELPACMLALSVDEVLNTVRAELGRG
jgi:ADP-heptose:LPS heptosyltransferase